MSIKQTDYLLSDVFLAAQAAQCDVDVYPELDVGHPDLPKVTSRLVLKYCRGHGKKMMYEEMLKVHLPKYYKTVMSYGGYSAYRRHMQCVYVKKSVERKIIREAEKLALIGGPINITQENKTIDKSLKRLATLYTGAAAMI